MWVQNVIPAFVPRPVGRRPSHLLPCYAEAVSVSDPFWFVKTDADPDPPPASVQIIRFKPCVNSSVPG